MELNMSKEEMRTKERGMGEKGKMSYESKAEKEKTGKSGIIFQILYQSSSITLTIFRQH